MDALWTYHRRAVLATVVVVASVTVIAASLMARHAGGHRIVDRRTTSIPVSQPLGPTPPRKLRPGPVKPQTAKAKGYEPSYVTPPATAQQEQFDSELAAAENKSVIAAAEVLVVPAGHDSTAFPAVPPADRTDVLAYADRFTTELLTIDYRTDTRPQVLAWAEAESAVNTLPGVPASIGWKALYASLADPSLPSAGGGTSPIPTPTVWAADAKARLVQRADHVTAGVDQQWSELIGEGFVPRDPLMSLIDISGTLTLTERVEIHPGLAIPEGKASNHAARRVNVRTVERTRLERFSLVLGIGSCLDRPGIGAINVEGWKVTR